MSKCALCASVLLYSRTSALSHLSGIALPMPVHSHTGSSRLVGCTCTISAFCVVPHCLVLCTALHRVCLAASHLWAEGNGRWISCNALPHCLEAVGSATPPMHCLTACGQWVVQLLLCTARLPGGSGQWNFCKAMLHCLGAVGSVAPAMHCLTAWGQWAVKLLQCTATPLEGGGQRSPRNAQAH